MWSACALAGAALILATLATVSHAPLTGDEALILSLSTSFAESGRLGTPLLEGIHGAGQHYFLSLPAVHLLHWPVLIVGDPSLAVLRVLSHLFVIVAIASACWVSYRQGGAHGLVFALLLLVFWRNGVLSSSHGLTMIGVGRSLRYDAMVAGLMALTLPLTVRWLGTRRPSTELFLGAVVGLAVLTHFPAWILPGMLAASWALAKRPRPAFASLVRVLIVAGLIAAPYVGWVASEWSDARAQVALVHGATGRLLGGPAALIDNLLSEPERYTALLGQPGLGPALFAVALPAVAIWSVAAFRHLDAIGRVSCAYLLVYLGGLWIFEATKAAIYVLPAVVPMIVLAGGLVPRASGSTIRALTGIIMAVLVAEGMVASVHDVRALRRLRTYGDVVEVIRSSVPRDQRWIGSMRWSRGFADGAFTTLPSLDWRSRQAGDAYPAFRAEWQRFDPTVILDTPEWRDDSRRLAPERAAFIATVSAQCGTPVRTLEDEAYGPVTVVALDRNCVAAIAR